MTDISVGGMKTRKKRAIILLATAWVLWAQHSYKKGPWTEWYTQGGFPKIFLLFALLLSGCGAFLVSDVTVFHDFSQQNVAGTSYAIIPLKEQEGSLEYKSYEAIVRQELNAKNLREAPLDQADVVVFFSYGIDSGQNVATSYPIFGQTGVSSSYSTGTVQTYGNTASYSGNTTYTPTYGVVGSGTARHTEYTRVLILDLLDRKTLADGKTKKVYEGKVVSRGSTGQLAPVLPTMVQVLFEEFPGKNGTTRTSRRSLE